MAEKKRGPDLELEQDVAFQRRDWAFERVGRYVLLLVLVASAVGLFGQGPLAHATMGDDTRLRVEYDRVARHRVRTVLRIHLGAAVTSDSVVRVWFDRRYLESIDVDKIVPQPTRQESDANRVLYAFAVTTPGLPTTVTFTIRPEGTGALRARLGADRGATLEFTQLILP